MAEGGRRCDGWPIGGPVSGHREEARMQVDVPVPQGWNHEYDGWDAARAWARSLQLARQAETLGCELVWLAVGRCLSP
jgi:hypothetical protein